MSRRRTVRDVQAKVAFFLLLFFLFALAMTAGSIVASFLGGCAHMVVPKELQKDCKVCKWEVETGLWVCPPDANAQGK